MAYYAIMTVNNHRKQQVCDAIDAMKPLLLSLSHAIHAEPELAFKEEKACQRLTEAVTKAGLPVKKGVFGLPTSYISQFGDEQKPCVAILSEYDALPGIGHACGHNIIATTGLGAALGLASLGENLQGQVRYLGTPAEERGGGKELMAQEGAFDGVSAALMVHPAGADLEIMPSVCCAEVEVIYHGRSAHAAVMPHAGINALDALVTAYQSIAQLRQHIKDHERVHGIFIQSGQAANVVPERASGSFYIRTTNTESLRHLKDRVRNCFAAGALATGCTLEERWSKVDYLALKNNPPLTKAYKDNAEMLGRTFFPMEKLAGSSAGSTDMGNISHRVPSIHPMISCAPPQVVIHNPEFTKWAKSSKGDKAVLDGAKALAMTALDYFDTSALRRAAKESFATTGQQSATNVKEAYNPEGVTSLGGCC